MATGVVIATVAPRADRSHEAPDVGIETCDSAEGLSAILRPDVDLVTWRRVRPRGLGGWLDRLAFRVLPDMRVLVRPGDLRRAMEQALDDGGTPVGAMRSRFIDDVDNLAAAYAAIARSGLVDVRLSRLRHDSCWKFHRDCVDARLLTTYRGPGTEWVRSEHAAEALREQKLFGGPTERLRVHDVALFKGSCTGPGRGVVHRSPPIAGTGQPRLLLCLNTRSAASPEPWSEGAAQVASPAPV